LALVSLIFSLNIILRPSFYHLKYSFMNLRFLALISTVREALRPSSQQLGLSSMSRILLQALIRKIYLIRLRLRMEPSNRRNKRVDSKTKTNNSKEIHSNSRMLSLSSRHLQWRLVAFRSSNLCKKRVRDKKMRKRLLLMLEAKIMLRKTRKRRTRVANDYNNDFPFYLRLLEKAS
jgi:hypothetical protein